MEASQPDGVVTIVITLRADLYAYCADFAELRAALERDQKYVGPMDEAELRRAIEPSAENGGWQLEPGLVDFMLGDVASELGALPLLSHALLEIWKRQLHLNRARLSRPGSRSGGALRRWRKTSIVTN